MNKMNKMIPIITFLVVAVIIALLYMLASSKSTPENKNSKKQMVQPTQKNSSVFGKKKVKKTDKQKQKEAIRDNYLETTRTLAVKQDSFEEKQKQVEVRLTRLEALEENLKKNLGEQIEQGSQSAFDSIRKKYDKKLSTLTKTVKNAASKLGKDKESEQTEQSSYEVFNASTPKINGASSDLPAGLGFDDLPLGLGSDKGSQPSSWQDQALNVFSSKDKYVTIKPIYSGAFASNSKRNKRNKKEIEYLSEADIVYRDESSIFDEDEDNSGSKNNKKRPAIPYYTINATATLFSNTSLTAMIGVVPYKGKIRDPYRFKVITGTENLSSNGHRIDKVKDVVWTGTLKGNREMSCVRGTVDTVSLVFWDGTISTQRASDTVGGLGYISDRWGKPCISGTLISNASQYLQDRLLASSMGSLAEAAAATETTQVTDAGGNVVSFVSGESKDYIASKTLSGMLGETSEYIKERQADAVDVVYIPSGQKLTIHPEEQIEFDYEPDGRKLNHEQINAASNTYFD